MSDFTVCIHINYTNPEMVEGGQMRWGIHQWHSRRTGQAASTAPPCGSDRTALPIEPGRRTGTGCRWLGVRVGACADSVQNVRICWHCNEAGFESRAKVPCTTLNRPLHVPCDPLVVPNRSTSFLESPIFNVGVDVAL